MKRTILLLGGMLLLAACNKHTIPVDGPAAAAQRILQTQLSAADYSRADLSTLTNSTLHDGHHIFTLRAGDEKIVLETDGSYILIKGAIYQVTGAIAEIGTHKVYNGNFTRSDLKRQNVVHWSIDQGHLKELHTYNVTGNAVNSIGGQQRVQYECTDCTLPEVVVSASYGGGGIS